MASGLKEIKLGDITPTRDLTFVRDTCRGFLALANQKETIGKEINISSNFEISILDLFNMIKEILGRDAKIVMDNMRHRPGNSEVFRLWGDNSLITSLTGFKPEYDLKKGLQLTCNWFSIKGNLSRYKATIYNV